MATVTHVIGLYRLPNVPHVYYINVPHAYCMCLVHTNFTTCMRIPTQTHYFHDTQSENMHGLSKCIGIYNNDN